MKASKLCWLALLPIIAACAGAEEEAAEATHGTAVTTNEAMVPPVVPVAIPVATDTSMAAMGHGAGHGASTIQLAALENSGVTGEASVAEQGQQSVVTLKVMGASASAVLQAHVHKGKCGSNGPVVAPLEPVTVGADGSGSSTTTVAVPMATVMNGEHYIQAHEPKGKPLTCAEIPSHGA